MKITKQNKKLQRREKVLGRYAMWRRNKKEWQDFYRYYVAKIGEKESIFCGMCK